MEYFALIDTKQFVWAEKLTPKLLKSPWWIGHIPFAYELIGRQRPLIVVELGTYSGSSFAAFCQAVEACGSKSKCYGIDLWEGDIHMGKFEETLFEEISAYVKSNYPDTAVLVRKDFNAACADFQDKSVDLLHIDGTHTFEAVSNDFHTWLPKLSDRAVVLFHDVNVNVENTGPASARFGVKQFFDSVKSKYPHIEFTHCWGLGVLMVGNNITPEILELAEMAKLPDFNAYFEAKGAEISRRFDALALPVATHGAYAAPPSPAPPIAPTPAPPIWRRAVNKLNRIVARVR